MTPLAIPLAVEPVSSVNRLNDVSSNLAQPAVVLPAGAADGSACSVSVPGIAQPQFLITDHAVPGSTATEWKAKKYDKAKKDDASSDRDGQTNGQSGWSLLWRQVTGDNKRPGKTSGEGVTPSSTRATSNNSMLPASASGLTSQLLPQAARRQGPANIGSVTSQNARGGESVWTEFKVPPKGQANVSRAKQPQSQGSYDSLVNQLGLPEQTASPSSLALPAASPQTGGILSALARPFTMQSNEPPIRRPAANQTADAAAASRDKNQKVPESEQVPTLLLPFYQTNNPPRTNRNGAQVAHARARNHGHDLEHTMRASKLMQQLALATDQDLRSQPGGTADSPLRTTQEAWDGGLTLPAPSELNPFTMTNTPEQPVRFASQAMTVAYLQESLPTPPQDGPEPDKINLPGDEKSVVGEQAANGENADGDRANGEGGENGEGKKKDELATADKLGEKPEDRSLEFLRAETVLLKPGKYQFDIGVQYILQNRNFPILFIAKETAPVVDGAHFLSTDGATNRFVVDEAHFRTRELEVPMQLRYGLFKKVQVFIGAPVGWSNTEVDLNHFDDFKNDGGLGDVYWGTTIQFKEAEADCPYVIGTGLVTAPSGGDPFTNAVGFAPSGPSLGNGFWQLAGNLLFIQPLDPVTFFYGAGIRGSFAHDYVGATFEPGMEYNYTFGMGFAVNEKVTFSTQLFGEYQSRFEVNGHGIEGSAQEPVSLQFAATIARPCEHYVEPFVQFGITPDAPSVNFGITWTY